MSIQQKSVEAQERSDSEYYDILKILEKRASKSRMTIIILIYTMMITASIVMAASYYIKTNQSEVSPLTNFLTSLSESAKTQAALRQFNETVQSLTNSTNTTLNQIPKQKIDDDLFSNTSSINALFAKSSPSEKIASSIASILLSFSLILFIGFVMKSILVFIRYYMQLGTDFDNQKIAFILSRGNQPQFQQYLTSLRDHNISFEKTPSLPQEKIITSLIEALGNTKKNI